MLHSGSCLCGRVSFEMDGSFDAFFFCHCSHCRKESGSAHGANLFSNHGSLRWLAGEPFVKTYRLPNTRFAKSFCTECGSALPTVGRAHGLVVPAGSLDTAVELRPTAHIHCASRASWDESLETVPRFDVYPT